MKKLLLTAIIALGTFAALQAQETENQNPTLEVQEEVEPKDATLIAKANVQTFKEVKISELPKAVTDAVAKDFAGASVQKAYVNEKSQFKLVLSSGDAKKAASKTVFVTKDGKWIKNVEARQE